MLLVLVQSRSILVAKRAELEVWLCGVLQILSTLFTGCQPANCTNRDRDKASWRLQLYGAVFGRYSKSSAGPAGDSREYCRAHPSLKIGSPLVHAHHCGPHALAWHPALKPGLQVGQRGISRPPEGVLAAPGSQVTGASGRTLHRHMPVTVPVQHCTASSSGPAGPALALAQCSFRRLHRRPQLPAC